MSNVYVDAIEVAKELIAESGQDVIWRKVPTETLLKPWKPSGLTALDYNVKIVFLPRDRVDTQMIRSNGDGAPIGNVYGLMGAVDFSPNPKDVVMRDGKECRIFAIDVLAPNGEPILYTIDFDL